jgi:hypothetical protein
MMESSKEEQIIIKVLEEDSAASKRGTRTYNPGLRALLSIKNISATLEKEYADFMKVERQLDETYKNGFLIIKANTLVEETARWKEIFQEVNNEISGIHDVLTMAKEKAEQGEKSGYPDPWKELTAHLTVLQENSKDAANSGFKLLPEAIHPLWDREFVRLETPLMESYIMHVDSYRVLLQMIDRYTPDELNAITQMIANHIPEHFTYEEALDYQNDYFKALVNFKNEFKKEKNLWDRFLDILAGGTHQSPSEGVMMERWLNGEEPDL